MKENFDSGIDSPSLVLAITGASGAIYGFSLLKALITRSFFVHLIISKPGFKVIKDELGMFADIFDVHIDRGTTPPLRAPLLEKEGSTEVVFKSALNATEAPLLEKEGSTEVVFKPALNATEAPLLEKEGSTEVVFKSALNATEAPLLEKEGSAEAKAGRDSLSSFNLRIKNEIINKFELHENSGRFAFLDENFLEAHIASGSAKNVQGMIVIPCSMGSLSRIASGNSGNLIERAADVMLKERKRLIVCPRETPFNDIHLKNMLSLYTSGAVILPPIPAFYNKPQTVDDIISFVTGKILDSLNIENDIYARWKGYDSK